MNLINLTQHKIMVKNLTFEPSGTVARVAAIRKQADDINVGCNGCPSYCWVAPDHMCVGMEIATVTRSFGEVENLPPKSDGVGYIVSALVLSALPADRDDCFAPDTSPESVIRDDAGNIVAVSALVRR